MTQPEFLAQWGIAIASAMSQIEGGEWTSELTPVELERPADLIAREFVFEKSLTGRLNVAIRRVGALELASVFTGEQVTEWNADQDETLDELFRQISGLVSTRTTAEIGAIEIRMERGETVTVGPSSTLRLLRPNGEPLTIWMDMDDDLQRALSPAVSVSPSTADASVPNNLDLLMNVQLAVTLRFGQREMLLQEILELQSGSVVELDRRVDDPVDLLLDGRIIARGNVVVVDGNYGLRISELGRVMGQQ